MGAGGIPSGGVVKAFGRVGSLARFGAKPNSRYDLYTLCKINGKEVEIHTQSRWYDHNGIVIRNRDYSETKFGVHDHIWSEYTDTWINKDGQIEANVERSRVHMEPDFVRFPTQR